MYNSVNSLIHKGIGNKGEYDDKIKQKLQQRKSRNKNGKGGEELLEVEDNNNNDNINSTLLLASPRANVITEVDKNDEYIESEEGRILNATSLRLQKEAWELETMTKGGKKGEYNNRLQKKLAQTSCRMAMSHAHDVDA